MNNWIFVSDLHGHQDRYRKLFDIIRKKKPPVVLMGGDLLPHQHIARKTFDISHRDFIHHYLLPEFRRLQEEMSNHYPRIFIILGNDDGRYEEASVLELAGLGIWEYIHMRRSDFGPFQIFGYAYVPPTPFLLKDWERYDISRYHDPGCISPEEGPRTVPVSPEEIRYSTIKDDLEKMIAGYSLESSIFLFHSPPYRSHLDRAALDGKMVEYAPLDVHVGSIAIRRFIEERQPLITLHGHIHESPRLTGYWQQQFGKTVAFSAAHDGPQLAVVEFNPAHPAAAIRTLI